MTIDPRQTAAEEAIAAFDFGDYGLDTVDILIREHREYQDWIPALARAVIAAVDNAGDG